MFMFVVMYIFTDLSNILLYVTPTYTVFKKNKSDKPLNFVGEYLNKYPPLNPNPKIKSSETFALIEYESNGVS